jgi:hypothetical protein
MRNSILVLILVCSSIHLSAQTETPVYKATTAKFVSFYNTERYDSILSMLTDGMKTVLPATFFKENLQPLGKISNTQFLKYQAPYTVYKVTFEKALFTLNIALDNSTKIAGFNFAPYKEVNVMQRNITKMKLPFKGEWTVLWGGDTEEQNYHVISKSQKNAFDIVIKDDNGKTFKTDGQKNEDYYAFGQELTTPCDGVVVLAVDGIKDNKPGEMNPMFATGNTVIIKTEKNEFLYFAHFKQFSVKVKEGQKVKQGQLLGLCGNSGNSSEAHIHFHLQNVENINTATGIKCYFDQLIVNGVSQSDYSPVQNDKIKN